MKTKVKIKWLSEPENHNYPAAESYLNLIYDELKASLFVKKLRKAEIVEFKSKDVFRASSLSLIGISNEHVQKNIDEINNGTSISPILLVRDRKNGKVVIADGYHRMCAVYMFHEDAIIPCKIV